MNSWNGFIHENFQRNHAVNHLVKWKLWVNGVPWDIGSQINCGFPLAASLLWQARPNWEQKFLFHVSNDDRSSLFDNSTMTEWMFWMNVGFVCRARCDVRVLAKRRAAQNTNAQRKRRKKKKTKCRRTHTVEAGMCGSSVAERPTTTGGDATHVYHSFVCSSSSWLSRCIRHAVDASEDSGPCEWVSERLVKPARIICVCVPMRRCIFNWNEAIKSAAGCGQKFFTIPFILSIDRCIETRFHIFLPHFSAVTARQQLIGDSRLLPESRTDASF